MSTTTATKTETAAWRRLAQGEAGWPAILTESPESPAAIWTYGEVLTGERPMVAIVGARAATAYGERIASEIGHGLAAAGVDVVTASGYGISAAALRGVLCVDAAGAGRPAAVLPGGIDRPHPTGCAALVEDVAARGAVLSAHAPGVVVTRVRLLEAARLVAALASAVVVVEAGTLSSSRLVATVADELGRPVLAVPGPVTSATSSGCHELIRSGVAHLARDAQDVLEALAL